MNFFNLWALREGSFGNLGDLMEVSDIFFFFFCSGDGKGESGATGREGGRFFPKHLLRPFLASKVIFIF